MFPVVLLALLPLALAEPNPPTWPANVFVLDPATPETSQAAVDKVFAENGGHSPAWHGEFSNSRYALLFLPGMHKVNVNVGYYTSVIGAGVTPSDTRISSVTCENGDFEYTGGALANFWRSAENFAVSQAKTVWAVSQAAPMRRVLIEGDLDLFQYNSGCCAGYASGGFLADSTVTGKITSGSQQQWISRNVRVGQWEGGVWNMVYVGSTGGLPAAHCGLTSPQTIVQTTPIVAEKPYVAYNGGRWTLRVPRAEKEKVGPTTDFNNVDSYDFERVFVARESDSAATINAKLAEGLNVVLTPGNYQLSEPIRVERAGAVLLGLGLPTLISANGTECIVVGAVPGVRVSSVLLQAGPNGAPALIRWGKQGVTPSGEPGFAHDIFARVGGPTDQYQQQVSADVMLHVAGSNVVVDNTWLWRADHGIGGLVRDRKNPVQNGLLVDGDDVTVYGLASEHTLADLVLWRGNNGRTYFYQSEFPYDVTQENYANLGYAAYRVADSVKTHSVWGAGAYSYWRDYTVYVDSAFKVPASQGVKLENTLTVFLNGNGGIQHIVNQLGEAVNSTKGQAYLCEF